MTTLTAATPTAGATLAPPAPVRAPGPAQGMGISGADVFRIIRQRLVLILFLWGMFIAATIGFTFYQKAYNPKYTAQAYIQVRSVRPPDPTNPLEVEKTQVQEVEQILNDQALIVESTPVLQAALQDAQVKNTLWYQEASQRKNEQLVDLLNDILTASPVRDSNFLSVTIQWKKPEEAAEIVNAVVEQYMTRISQLQRDQIRDQEQQLQNDLQQVKRRLDQQRLDMETFRATGQVFGEEGRVSENLLTLQALVTELEVELLGRQAQYEALRDASQADLPINADLQAILQSDPAIFQLEQRLQVTDEGLRQLKSRFGPNHRAVRDQLAARDAAATALAEEQAVKILQYRNQQLEQARRAEFEAQQQLIALREKLLLAQAAQKDRDKKYAQYLSMEEEAEFLKLQHESLSQQKEMLSMLLRRQKTVQVDVTQHAIPPQRLTSPKPLIWIPFGVLAGLGASIGFAVLLELTDKSVRTPRDVMRQQLPVLGTILTSDDDEIEIDRVETACIDAPHSVVAESFRNLRANLFFSAPAEQQGVLLVTSPSGGNGKTTVSVNLGISIALSGRRVLLVDANFRRSSLPRLFNGMREEGLSNILIGQSRLADLVTTTEVPGLDVLSAGPIPPNPAELLGSSYLRDLIVEARGQYDQVIFDGPPVLLVSDAMVLAGAVDGVLLICQYRETSRGALQRTQTQLHAMSARIFGAVLNMVETRAGGYFRQAYREFYEYQEQDEDEDVAPRKRLDVGEMAVAEATAGGVMLSGSGSSSADDTADDAGSALDEVAGLRIEPDLDLEGELDIERSLGVESDVGAADDDAADLGEETLDEAIDKIGRPDFDVEDLAPGAGDSGAAGDDDLDLDDDLNGTDLDDFDLDDSTKP